MNTKALYALPLAFFMASSLAIAHDNNPSFRKIEELDMIMSYNDPDDNKPRGLFRTASGTTVVMDCAYLDQIHIRAVLQSKEKNLWRDEQDKIHRIEHNAADAQKKMHCPANNM